MRYTGNEVFSHLILAFFKFLLQKSKSREGIFRSSVRRLGTDLSSPPGWQRLRLSGTTHNAMLFLKAKAFKSLTRETSSETKRPAGHALSLPPITAGMAPRSSALANQLRGRRPTEGRGVRFQRSRGPVTSNAWFFRGAAVATAARSGDPQLLPRAPCPPCWLSALPSALPACRGDPGPDRISEDAPATAGSGGGGWRHGDVGRVRGRALSAGREWS